MERIWNSIDDLKSTSNDFGFTKIDLMSGEMNLMMMLVLIRLVLASNSRRVWFDPSEILWRCEDQAGKDGKKN